MIPLATYAESFIFLNIKIYGFKMFAIFCIVAVIAVFFFEKDLRRNYMNIGIGEWLIYLVTLIFLFIGLTEDGFLTRLLNFEQQTNG